MPGGGGGADSLGLGTNCETTAPPPFFDKGQPLVLLFPNLQPPLFMDTQEQPLEISIKWEFSVLHTSYFSKLLYQKLSKINMHVYNCYNCRILDTKTLTAPLSYNIIREQPPFLSHLAS